MKVNVSTLTGTGSISGTAYSANIGIGSLPFGNHTVTVTATDVVGGTGSASVAINVDHRPVVAVTTPVNDAVVSPTTPISATCSDDGPSGCSTIKAVVEGVVVASGTNSLTGTMSLAAWAGKTIVVQVQGTDSRGQVTTVSRNVIVSSGGLPPPLPGLTGIASLGGPVLDFDGTKAIYANPARTSAWIRDISTAAETAIYSSTTAVKDARLVASRYAALSTATGAWEWNGTTLSAFGMEYAVGGSKIVFGPGTGGNLVIRDPATSSTVYTSPVTTAFFALSAAPNDDIVFDERLEFVSSTILKRWRGGTVTNLASFGRSLQASGTDGINVVYEVVFAGGYPELWLVGLGSPLCAGTLGGAGCGKFALRGGWITYSKLGAALQTWRRSPSGVSEKVSVFTADCIPEDISPSGQVLYTSSGRRYLANDGMSVPVDVSAASGRPVFVAGAWYLLMDNNIYRIDGTSSGDAGPGDAGTGDTSPAIDSGMASDSSAADSGAPPDTTVPGDVADALTEDTLEMDSAADTSAADTETVDATTDGSPPVTADADAEAPDANEADAGGGPPPDESGGCLLASRGAPASDGALYVVIAALTLSARRRSRATTKRWLLV